MLLLSALEKIHPPWQTNTIVEITSDASQWLSGWQACTTGSGFGSGPIACKLLCMQQDMPTVVGSGMCLAAYATIN